MIRSTVLDFSCRLLNALLGFVLIRGPAISAEVQAANTVSRSPETNSNAFIPDMFSFRYGCFRPQVDSLRQPGVF
jgi:hypothetical protein